MLFCLSPVVFCVSKNFPTVPSDGLVFLAKSVWLLKCTLLNWLQFPKLKVLYFKRVAAVDFSKTDFYAIDNLFL